jgi:hypothetical protein
MVELFTGNSPVTSRLGQEAMIQIPALQDPDVDKFVKGVIAYLRAPAFDVNAAIAKHGGATKEKFDPGVFPFTVPAIEALKSKTDPLTPRAINMQMTRALGRAHRKGLEFISTDCIG